MEIFQSAASDKELLVADILLEMPRMISILESQGASRESTLPKNWACKRKRSSSPSSSSCSSETNSAANANALASMASSSSSSSFLPPEQITAIMPPAPPQPIINVENHQSLKFRVSREKGKLREGWVVCKLPETKPLPLILTVAKTSEDEDGLKLSEAELNPRKKTRTEELNENLFKLSQQRRAVANGKEEAKRIYECLNAYKLQLEEKEKELKLCLEQEEEEEEEASEKLPLIIDDHWLALSLKPLQQSRFLPCVDVV